jgi:hypothetical protein
MSRVMSLNLLALHAGEDVEGEEDPAWDNAQPPQPDTGKAADASTDAADAEEGQQSKDEADHAARALAKSTSMKQKGALKLNMRATRKLVCTLHAAGDHA